MEIHLIRTMKECHFSPGHYLVFSSCRDTTLKNNQFKKPRFWANLASVPVSRQPGTVKNIEISLISKFLVQKTGYFQVSRGAYIGPPPGTLKNLGTGSVPGQLNFKSGQLKIGTVKFYHL